MFFFMFLSVVGECSEAFDATDSRLLVLRVSYKLKTPSRIGMGLEVRLSPSNHGFRGGGLQTEYVDECLNETLHRS